MNRQETIKRLNALGVAEDKAEALNLTEADLSDADLSDADLSDADLTRADLSDADLTGADLIGANLIGADLRGANLAGALNISMSHDICAEIIRQGADGDIRIESFAGLILLHREWCWKDFIDLANHYYADVSERIKEIIFADPAWGCRDAYEGGIGDLSNV